MTGRTSQAKHGYKLHEPAYEHNYATAPVILSCSCPPKDLIAPDSPIAWGQKPEQISPHRRKAYLGVRWTAKGHEDGSNRARTQRTSRRQPITGSYV